ncbi:MULTISPECIES: DivIVA domain-containing protein [unclassified Pseudofrankia]|uniref:DivIVA domain-containing protein n=1 Tax=unclassified Pseudofrankia TaxID=2994372 RepID=UPI0008DB21DB|nr:MULTISPECIES: DivIVA domain-containing protein [unclassified Pseudofrankia]MDT3441076.1 DivIVA domain-containing protein [Pseudofrankia sp. BMG5.37]OHV42574.1 cell division protein DivIVA [Pseudofrankia sp. BMG5.36]
MALTPQDVQNKVFSPTRFRTGYNEDEVDTFLDEVEAELTRMLDENSDLRRQLDEARRTGGGGPGVPPQILEENQQLRRQLDDARRAAAQAQAAAQQAQAQAQAAAARGPSTSPVPIPGGATQVMPAVGQRGGGVPATAGSQLDAEIEQRVARTLVLAQRTADEALREARTESERARREARSDADRILAEARAHVAEQLGGLEEDKRRLEGQVEQLRAFEREYRTRLRAYLEMQLRDLDGMPTQPAVGPGGPARPGLNPGTQGGGQPQPAGVGVPAAAYQPGPPAMGGQNGVNHAERDPRAGGMQEF